MPADRLVPPPPPLRLLERPLRAPRTPPPPAPRRPTPWWARWFGRALTPQR